MQQLFGLTHLQKLILLLAQSQSIIDKNITLNAVKAKLDAKGCHFSVIRNHF
jgi:hypothetical protein